MNDIALPKSAATVSVKVFNVSSPTTNIPAGLFLTPVKPGREKLFAVAYSFLIEHPSGRKVLFDLGPMKDFSKLPPAMQGLLSQAGFEMSVDTDITEQLKNGGVSLGEIDTVIWSHSHFDHTGDMSLFPSTTKLLIGQGTDRRAFPTVPDAMLLESDFAGREVVEVNWENPDLIIGGAPAIDFFGDGSFYLLDMPGHWPGHLTGLARVKENSFVLLGASAQKLSLSSRYPHDLSKPILSIPEGFSMYADRATALTSQVKLQTFDAHPDVFVITAHDMTLEGIITLYPESVDNWKELGWKPKAAWAFLQEGNKGYGYH
ncbi:hypothetical protein GYMLUDRAFT_88244 [Collybiopsis luxurians FD-317 M1]|uniref:Metallo-beta-lactamase domain-containing protein n=1 Tax=Collybiopsis luxurians FD-317 M1 TaxID=944289 RepID=A0A0D0BWL4_9AGAR|nr:hypothetical protein GYMLUDRAFT_88244 [Collybiopsis luxurians FD-317 M1]